MQPLPHHYNVNVAAGENGPTKITSPGLNPLISAPPREFDGPGNLWSPETFVVAAVADCLVLTFRAVAKAAKLDWTNVACDATGVVDRSDGVTRFTEVRLHVRLSLPFGSDAEKARKVLEKAEKACLIGNSLKCEHTIDGVVIVEEPALAPTA
jgi:peroxiredoxin-like protein